MTNKRTNDLSFDRQHIWHPYTSMTNPLPSYFVESAEDIYLTLGSGEQVIDAMSSWWAVIHGYNHPEINQAMKAQIDSVSHVMFGGITHQPAIDLCRKLVEISPNGLDKVFLSDSGSVAVEVAIKMALQYWNARHSIKKQIDNSDINSHINTAPHTNSKTTINTKTKLLTVRNGYHGDTFAAMSVCDPVNGMHQIFDKVLSKHFFAPAPQTQFNQSWDKSDVIELTAIFEQHHQEIAALIIEPIVQGAGGMRIYHPQYLKTCRELCDKYDVLLIADEIATGFGRTGKLFACEWAEITPDILCVGKALTGGYMSLAATLCSDNVANTISKGEAGCFMHGPTFMGNPLACAAANASLKLLEQNNWQENVLRIENTLQQLMTPLQKHPRVTDVRVLGAIGVIEATQSVNMQHIQKRFVEMGVWIRPFGKLIYIMPSYVMSNEALEIVIKAIATVLNEGECFN